MALDSKDLRQFFKLRLKEAYHKDTLDSYRVRNHNALTLLDELQRVIQGRLNNRVKRNETVVYCIEETIDILKTDECIDFSFFDKEQFITDLGEYKNELRKEGESFNIESSRSILFYIRKCYNLNKTIYLKNILDKIENCLFNDRTIDDKDFSPVMIKLDTLVLSLATELIHIGYSKFVLHKYFDKLNFGKNEAEDRQTFNSLKIKFSENKKKNYIVIFRLQANGSGRNNKIDFSNYPEFSDGVSTDLANLVTKNKSEIKQNPAVKFFQQEVSALDNISAIKEARILLSSVLDKRQNGNNQFIINIPHEAFTFEKQQDGSFIVSYGGSQFLDSTNGNSIVNTQNFVDSLSKIEKDPEISHDVKDRIKFALRHLRIGDAQPEMEQRFINYWVGLEFIFSSPSSNESTFVRMKKYLTEIQKCCYAKRNILHFNKWLINANVISKNAFFWEEEKIDTQIESKGTILALYHYKMIKSKMLGKSDKRKTYVESHKINVERHISRLYRLRNELIHEASTKEEIESTTSNLRYYLVFLLNQIVSHFAKSNNSSTISDFFMNYECTNRRLALKWDFSELMAVDFEDNLLS